MTASAHFPHAQDARNTDADDAPLLELLRRLDAESYQFVTPTPATHARVLGRPGRREAQGLRDIMGWSLPFDRAAAPDWLVQALEAAGLLEPAGDLLKSAVRVSRVHGRLFLHSAYPTDAEDAVFLGPDSYRFADFIQRELTGASPGPVADVGGGAGVGALVAADLAPGAELWLTDVNPKALRFARVNARHAGVALRLVESDGLDGVPEGLATVMANPPYMADSDQAYRDGQEMHGAGLSVRFAEAALEKLRQGGRLLLYTGSAILDGGRDQLREALTRLAATRGAALRYRELDPDVFGEELEAPAYQDVERIAVVGCVLTKA